MSIEIVKIHHKKNEGFSIWIDEEQNLNLNHLLKDLYDLNIEASKIIYQSFGPAEILEKYTTKTADFFIHLEFDAYAGTTIYSQQPEIMYKIYDLMISSGHYRLRS